MRCVCDWLLVVRLVGSRGRRADAVGDGEWDGTCGRRGLPYSGGIFTYSLTRVGQPGRTRSRGVRGGRQAAVSARRPLPSLLDGVSE